ncbi:MULTISPECIES: glycosyltransferase [unclassified Microcoleus]|uniref:glycosyltransferase n=1 Tax=unclassified Microcoleus TaxID=2642155 RepID=UPI002FD5F427
MQPIIFNHLAVCYNFTAVNDPTTDSAFAGGQFMLFRRSAYEKFGGHKAVAGEIVEDVELARRIKSAGLKLGLYSGSNLASVRMYRSWIALWEGWTKNLYLGANRSWGLMVYMAAIMFFIYPMPWRGFFIILKQIISVFPLSSSVFSLPSSFLVKIVIWHHYNLRRLGAEISECPTRYW